MPVLSITHLLRPAQLQQVPQILGHRNLGLAKRGLCAARLVVGEVVALLPAHGPGRRVVYTARTEPK